MTPRIAIDARFFGPSGTGPGRYVQRLVEYLARLPADMAYVLLLSREGAASWTPPDRRFSARLVDAPWYSLAEQVRVPQVLRSIRPDLVHFPHFNVPLGYRGPFVVTIHDLIITHFATRRATTLGPLAYALKQLGYRLVITQAARRAKRVLTVSSYSRQELVHTFHLRPDRILVTYEAADAARPEPPAEGSAILQAHRIPSRFILYVGNTYPHKNLERFLRGYAAYRAAASQPYPFVLVGRRDYFSRRLEAYARTLGLADLVHFPGFIADEELPAFYQGAWWYVFPSLYEGFGLPPLEAMQYGLPVLSSDATCLPEILGDAAVYFSPHSSRAMAEALRRTLHDDRLREDMGKRGRVWVARYSWERMVRETLHAYRDVLAELRRGSSRG
ncbi:MAG: glycosyltransferase family 4 protein [Candidatus Kerfeldbacteria bacterium]|nr:glycosyltransferase family 4 protein [Candidatus Kerfeldbacteria bacterium]